MKKLKYNFNQYIEDFKKNEINDFIDILINKKKKKH